MPAKLDPRPASVRVSESLKKLADSSTRLNTATGELAKEIAPLEVALKAFNLGVPAWHDYTGHTDEHGNYWKRYIGYSKVGGKWGLAISQVEGNENSDYSKDDEWLFNDAPRWMRLEAFDHIPELLEKLVAAVDETTERMQSKLGDAKELGAVAAELAAAMKKK